MILFKILRHPILFVRWMRVSGLIHFNSYVGTTKFFQGEFYKNAHMTGVIKTRE